MTMRRRQPLVLVNTAVAVNSVLNRSCAKVGTEETGSTIWNSASEIPEDHEDNSGIVLTAGLLIWQGLKLVNGPDIETSRCNSLEEQLGRRFGGKECGVFDEFTTVGLSASTLMRLSLSSGSWVRVKDTLTSCARPAIVMVLDPPESSAPRLGLPYESKLSSREGGSGSIGFPMYCFASGNDQQFDEEVAFLSPILAFNLGIHVSWLEFLTSGHDVEDVSKFSEHDSTGLRSTLQRVTSDSCNWSYSVEIKPLLPVLERAFSDHTDVQKETVGRRARSAHVSVIRYATHVRIGLVRIPSGLLPPVKGRQAAIDASLQDYFKIDRHLARGDIFSVQLVVNTGLLGMANTDRSSSAPNSPLEFVFFKVLALEPSTESLLCANHNHTALVLGGSVAAQLPPLARSTHLGNAFLRTPAVKQLTALLAPCLHPGVLPLQLRLSVLIHGPSGSGKQTVVRLAAENLGMHVVEYNCYDFVGGTEGKMTAALMNSFKTAKRYSPALLLLRCFEAFGRSASTGSSPGDQQASASRLASVLKMCIAAHLPSTSQETHNDSNGWSLADEITDIQSKESSSIKLAGVGSGPKEGLVLAVAACESAESLAPILRRCFTHEVIIGMPNENERLALLKHYLAQQNDDTMEASLRATAAQTSGLTPRDLRAVAADTGAIAIIRSGQSGQSSQKIKLNSLEVPSDSILGDNACEVAMNAEEKSSKREIPVQLYPKDLKSVLGRVKLRTASAIGTPKVPNVKWEDVGGLEDVKKSILDTVQLPLVHRELFSTGLRQRSGVLLYGPPGTGKTLLAKAVATECALNFLSVKGPELINMYIGESEKNVREIFHKARAAKPCVVFFDELDALAPARGASGDSGGVMDRVVSQMLAEIDGVSDNSQDLFIIGASNRPDLIDPALLRPGRFDKLLYVGVSSENSYRERVLEALTRKFKLHDNVSMKGLAQRCPVTYTGADMYALCADAWQQAVKREVSALERRRGSNSSTEIETVVVKEEDFMKAMGELTPSLSRAELDRYERLRVQFEGQ